MISLEKGDGAVSESEVKAGLNGTNGFGMPLFGFPRIGLPGVFGKLAEQGVARAQEGCEKIKATSGEMAEALRETYSSNGRSATDYGLKVIEISNARDRIRPKQGIVGACPESCDGNGRADQEARRQGSPPNQLKNGTRPGFVQEGDPAGWNNPRHEHAAPCSIKQRAGARCPQVTAPTRGSIQPAGFLF